MGRTRLRLRSPPPCIFRGPLAHVFGRSLPGQVARNVRGPFSSRCLIAAQRWQPKAHGVHCHAGGQMSKSCSWRRRRSRESSPRPTDCGADAIVLGWRGHGPIRRFVMGSISRGVVRGASSAVVVVRKSQHVRKIVVGLDGSPNAARALTFVGRLSHRAMDA